MKLLLMFVFFMVFWVWDCWWRVACGLRPIFDFLLIILGSVSVVMMSFFVIVLKICLVWWPMGLVL